jgi:septum formation protein
MRIPFEVVVPDIAEAQRPGESPDELVSRLSREKARWVARSRPDALIIAADTVVVLDGQVLGKPENDADALCMLRSLRGRPHRVYSGLTVLDAPTRRYWTEVARTRVCMRDYSDDEISAYLETGEHRDKAGSYAIQSDAFDPVARIDGCYANVVGFPVCHLYRILRRNRLAASLPPRAICPAVQDGGCASMDKILRESVGAS